MKNDFDELIDRKNTNSSKWSGGQEELAMGIADMDFKSPPCVQKAIAKKVAFGIFGYSDIPEAYYTSYQNWWKRRHNFTIEREWMVFSSGVIPAISSLVRRLTSPAENVVVLTPVYNIFYNCILNNGRNVLFSDLQYKDGVYEVDFDDLESKLKDSQTTMMILCNPHNPIGKIWSSEELMKIGALCAKHHVLVISDEVHCDLCEPGMKYTPFASINEQCAHNSITCLSASKTFNLAGLQSACLVIPNKAIFDKVSRGLNNDEVAEPNVFACEAVIAAFEEGEEWLEEVNAYISENKLIAKAYIETYIPQLALVSSQATYLLWIEYKECTPFIDQFCTYLYDEKQMRVASGTIFKERTSSFIRINIACPRERMLLGLKRLKEGVEAFSESYIKTC